MQLRPQRKSRRIAVALICAFAATQAVAQQVPASPPVAANDNFDPASDAALSPEDRALLDNALVFDSVEFGSGRPDKTLRFPNSSSTKALDVVRNDGLYGTSTVVVGKPLATEWDAKVGADLGLAANAPVGYGPDNPLRVTRERGGSGAAWASVGVPSFATVDARVDPSNDIGRVGTTFTRSIPMGGQFDVMLQSRYSMTETFGQPQTAPSDIPLMAAPASDPADPVPRVWGNENLAKFNILSTGTTFVAGLSATSTDPVTHNTLSAEQKLYGPLHVTTGVSDIGRPGESKNIRARFKLNW